MDFYKQPQSLDTASRAVDVDAGLRAYMLRVYNYMASALIITGLVAYFAAQSEGFINLMTTINSAGRGSLSPIGWVVLLAPLGVVMYLSSRIHAMSEGAAKAWFWGYAALMGLSLWTIFATFTGESIVRVFFITSASFAGLSLYGYSTKRDLGPIGNFLVMGLIGIVIASLVNLFLQSSGLSFVTSILGVLIFAGLTAYDTQKLKIGYYQMAGADLGKAAVMGALNLYLDFINLFMLLLRIMGNRR